MGSHIDFRCRNFRDKVFVRNAIELDVVVINDGKELEGIGVRPKDRESMYCVLLYALPFVGYRTSRIGGCLSADCLEVIVRHKPIIKFVS